MRTSLIIVFFAALYLAPASAAAADQPNVLWITSEDTGPHLGCYGDTYAVTPNIDQLAKKGLRFTNAWATAPVCAPARTVIITGMWAPSLGAEHMRSQVHLPDAIKAFPQYLREAGYYCTNNAKTDYNVTVNMRATWDESSNRAHWKNRKERQPFFAVFNFSISHESQIRNTISAADRVHDPAAVRIPAYHPDTPEVRKDWAQYYDRLTMMDRQCGELLAELQSAGLEEDTIVFYFGDHGSGMPRNKRSACNSGLAVPLIVYVPPKWQHLAPTGYSQGGTSERLVSFYDLAPTVLSICGVAVPQTMHGKPVLGPHEEVAAEPSFAFGFRGRMDERYDLVRVVRDRRYVYIRNFMPHKPHGQHVSYMFETPTTRVWKNLFDERKLTAAQSQFWQRKSSEELYDLHSDPDEVHNLANSPEHQEIVQRMRAVLMQQLREWRDLGFLPENEIHSRAAAQAPWTMAQDDAQYPIEKILAMADHASTLPSDSARPLLDGMSDPDSAVRCWAALGLQVREQAGVRAGRAALHQALSDSASAVRITAAEALACYGDAAEVTTALDVLLDHGDVTRHDLFTAMLALNALQSAEMEKLRSVHDRIAALPTTAPNMPPRAGESFARLLEKLRADLEADQIGPE